MIDPCLLLRLYEMWKNSDLVWTGQSANGHHDAKFAETGGKSFCRKMLNEKFKLGGDNLRKGREIT